MLWACYGLLVGHLLAKILCEWPFYFLWSNISPWVELMQFLGPFGAFWPALSSGYFFWHGPFCTMETMPLHIRMVSSGTSMG